MKAIGARRHLPASEPGCLVAFDAPAPELKPHDLLVEIRAVSVNPVDTKIRASLGEGPHDPLRILGWDAAGVVRALGSEASGFAVGDEVYYSGDLTRPGCNAEFQAVDSRLVAHKPPSWSFADAAAIPLVALTAWELLFERMAIDPAGTHRDQPLLIINGAGGVGSAMIVLAKRAGLRVIATASRPETREWCLSLGADRVIDHRQPLRPQAGRLDVPYFPFIANLHDTGSYWETTADLIAPFGTLGLIVEPKEKLHIGDPLKAKCVRIAWEFMAARSRFQSPDMHRQGGILAELAALCEAGSFPKLATRTLPDLTPETLREAHEAMENSRAIGKWVLEWRRESQGV
jgi:NADPH:quinone reductase